MSQLSTIEVRITGMRCTSCSNKIEESVKKISGVKNVVVSVSLSKGRVDYDEKLVGAREIVESIKSLGFGVTPIGQASKLPSRTK